MSDSDLSVHSGQVRSGEVRPGQVRSGQVRPLAWLDQIKGIALLAIILIHGVERMFKPPLFSNPTYDWPNLADRIAQVMPLDQFGVLNLPVNLFRYVGWMGDQGVQLFLLTSGFGLTWGLLARSQSGQAQSGQAQSGHTQSGHTQSSHTQSSFSWKIFYQRRLFRLYPMWWMAHLLMLGISLLVRKLPGAALTNPDFYLSFVGIRFTRELFYALSPSWWFIGLLIQLYLLYPLLWSGFQKLGPTRLLLLTCAIALPIRGLGMFLTGDYLECWSRGSIFITRLPEFVLGMSLAGWWSSQPDTVDRRLRSRRVQVAGLVTYVVGYLCAYTLLGMTVSPFLLGVGLFILLYGLLQGRAKSWLDRLPLTWLGKHSYAIFLVQHFFIRALMPPDQVSLHGIIGFVIATATSLLGGIALEKITDLVTVGFRKTSFAKMRLI